VVSCRRKQKGEVEDKKTGAPKFLVQVLFSLLYKSSIYPITTNLEGSKSLLFLWLLEKLHEGTPQEQEEEKQGWYHVQWYELQPRPH
jgi:hypothetical protein